MDCGSGLITGRGLSIGREVLDDRGVFERPANRLERTGDTKGERLLLWAMAYDRSAGNFDGLSTGRVFALSKGLGPRENFCVLRFCAAFSGCEVGKRVKLDRAGEVARRRGTGCPFAARKGYNIVSSTTMFTLAM